MKATIVLLVAAMTLSPAAGWGGDGGGASGEAALGTTVKSTKSNGNDRMGGDADARGTSVKSGKSNTSDRVTGGDAGERGTTVKGSKSNSDN